VRDLLTYYEHKFGDPLKHPPSDLDAAQVLAVAPAETVLRIVQSMATHERIRPGERYSWWCAVIADRVHGIRWTSQHRRAAKIRLVSARRAMPA
jgi:hypothetical protein